MDIVAQQPASVGPSYCVGNYLEVTPYVCLLIFGRWKGQDIVDVPTDYLRWALQDITDAPEEFGTILRAELHRRLHEGVGSLFGEDETP